MCVCKSSPWGLYNPLGGLGYSSDGRECLPGHVQGPGLNTQYHKKKQNETVYWEERKIVKPMEIHSWGKSLNILRESINPENLA